MSDRLKSQLTLRIFTYVSFESRQKSHERVVIFEDKRLYTASTSPALPLHNFRTYLYTGVSRFIELQRERMRK